jgi:hypothetical protein
VNQIAELKHQLLHCLHEIDAASAMLSSLEPSVKDADTTRHWFDVTSASLCENLKIAQQQQQMLTLALQPGCNYFTLIRSARDLHAHIEATVDDVHDFFDRVTIGAKLETAKIEPT